jgi:hypothetical protein
MARSRASALKTEVSERELEASCKWMVSDRLAMHCFRPHGAHLLVSDKSQGETWAHVYDSIALPSKFSECR